MTQLADETHGAAVVSAALARISAACGMAKAFGSVPASLGNATGMTPVFVLGGSAADRQLLRGALESDGNFSVVDDTEILVGIKEAIESSWSMLVRLGHRKQYWYKTMGEQFAAGQCDRAAASGRRRWVQLVDDRQLSFASLDRMFPRSVIVHLAGERRARRSGSTSKSLSRLNPSRLVVLRTADLRADRAGTLQRLSALLATVEAPPAV